MTDSDNIRKIKVAPYPFFAVLRGNFGSHTESKGAIVKLTVTGFLMEVPIPCVVGEKYEVEFTLPVIGTEYIELVVAVKSYDKMRSKTSETREIYHLVELHFRSLKVDKKVSLENFLRQIGQVK